MDYADKYKVDVPIGKSGDWRIKRIVVTKKDAKFERMRSFFNGGRGVPQGTYTGLYNGGAVIMSDTPDEIRDHLYAIRMAKGDVLINGLGLGVVLNAVAQKPEVGQVYVVELSEDVINLVGPHYKNKFGDKVIIIQADALEYKPPKGKRFGAVWHDIWPSICADNLPDMKILHRRYGRITDWQGSWAREQIHIW